MKLHEVRRSPESSLNNDQLQHKTPTSKLIEVRTPQESSLYNDQLLHKTPTTKLHEVRTPQESSLYNDQMQHKTPTTKLHEVRTPQESSLYNDQLQDKTTTTGYPRKHDTFKILNKKSQHLVWYTLKCSNIKEYVKIYFKALPALSFVNIVFPVTSKMMSPNKENSVIFSTKIGLKVFF